MAIKKKLLKDIDWNSIISSMPTATRTTPGTMAPTDKRFMPQKLMGNNQTGLFIFGNIPQYTELGFILLTIGKIGNVTSDAGVYIIRIHQDTNDNFKIRAKLIPLDGANLDIKVYLKNGNILAITRFSGWETINFISTIPFVNGISRQDGTDGFEVVAE